MSHEFGPDEFRVSHSMVRTYLDCPERFRLERVKGVRPSHRSCEQVFGIALHGALADYHQQLQAGVVASPDEVVHKFDELFSSEQLGPVAVQWTDAGAAERMSEQARELTNLYIAQRTARRVLGVEVPFRINPEQLSGSFAFTEPLAGIVDLIEEEDDGTIYITELKTSGKRLDQLRVSFDLQMSIYAAAREVLQGSLRISLSDRDYSTKNRFFEIGELGIALARVAASDRSRDRCLVEQGRTAQVSCEQRNEPWCSGSRRRSSGSACSSGAASP